MERMTKPGQRNQRRQWKRLGYVRQYLLVLIKFHWIAILVIILTSCYPFMPADKKYLLEVEKRMKSEVEEGKKSMVILRVALELDGEPHEPFIPLGVEIKLGGFKTGGKLQHYRSNYKYYSQGNYAHFCLSSETCKQGWTFFFLDPGIHYFSFRYLTPLPNPYENHKNPPLWRFDIPTGAKSIYIGTLNLKGVGIDKGWMWGPTGKVNLLEINVIDEINLADKIINEFYPRLGPPQSLIMRKHEGGPIYIRPPD
jgi:hypothetical protein